MGGSHAYEIRPVTKSYLRAMIGGKAIFRKMFAHPPLPQRAWFHPSIEEMQGEFLEGLREACVGALSGGIICFHSISAEPPFHRQ